MRVTRVINIKIMQAERFRLEKYTGTNSRHICPSCGDKRKTFSRYLDLTTFQPVHPDVGRCDREAKCRYHMTPSEYFKKNKIPMEPGFLSKPVTIEQKPISLIDINLMKGTLRSYEQNNFIYFLDGLFGIETTDKLIDLYKIGTSKHWTGSTVFWQIDAAGKIRTGKIMLYDPETGRRIKSPTNCISWVHSSLKLTDFKVKQCLFGEHLLVDKVKSVAIVESEKTAIIASVYFPQFIWLATGGKSNLPLEKMKVLSGRKVVLFPDVKGYEDWKNKMDLLSRQIHETQFSISDLLEKNASEEEREQGFDIADYLIKFHTQQSQSTQSDPEPLPEWYIKIEVMFDEIKRIYGTPHLLPCMEDQSYVVDMLPF